MSEPQIISEIPVDSEQNSSEKARSSRARQIAILRRLEWSVRHAAENVLGGEYRSAFRGRGMEFDQVVKYEWGDDVRDIDWNVTARLGEPYRKKYIEEREVSVLLLFEDSPSLQFGSGSRTKREALLELTGLVALLSAINRDRLGICYCSPAGYWYREPVVGRGKVMHSCATLFAQLPPPSHTSAPVRVPWRYLFHAAPKHTLLVWFGDFPPGGETPDGWATLRKRYQTFGMRVDDPWERKLPDVGAFTVFDPVSSRLVMLNPDSTLQRKAHAKWAADRDVQFQRLFPNKLSRHCVTTEDNQLDQLVRFFKARMSYQGN